MKALATELAAITTRPWTLMEVCGGQTHAIVRWGLDQLLPDGVRLIHGPGCPVCVTPADTIQQALRLARRSDVILCSYGDMLRVPGEGRDTLLSVRAGGGDVRLLTSPLQALQVARSHPARQVVFLAVGFETTAPATALLARQALALGIGNLSLLAAHVRVSPAMDAILAEPHNRVQGFLAAGHVCSVLGTAELEHLVARRRLPVVVSGFEPLELMAGVLACVRQLEAGEARVENAYGTVVRAAGNPAATTLLAEVFEPCDRPWRGLGVMAGGGLALRGPYRALDALERFGAAERDGTGVAAPERVPGAVSGSVRTTTEDKADSRGAVPAAPRHADGSLPESCGACGLADAGDHPMAARSAAHPDRLSMANRRVGPPPSSQASHDGGSPTSEANRHGDAERLTALRRSGATASSHPTTASTDPCIAGSILRGLTTPAQCPVFGSGCTPERPLGAPMVSSEGACAAYFLYRHRGPGSPQRGEGER